MRRNSLIILLLLITTVNSYGIVRLQENTETDSREQNLKDTKGEFSYIVSLQEWTKGENHTINVARQCIGSAITKHWILTAGHCITKKLSHVEYGQEENRNYTTIISKQLHPGYRKDYSFGGYYAILNNNIALVKVEGMDLKKYARLSARDHNTILGEVVKYAGYGGLKITHENKSHKKTDTNHREKTYKRLGEEDRLPAELRVAEGGVIKCELERYIIFQPAICVASKCGRQKLRTSQGDSGGPLTLDKRIIGVSSGNSPIMNDVFTPVSPFLEWISSTINIKPKSNQKHC